MKVSVQTQDFDLGAELDELRRAGRGVGAIAAFVGLVRDLNDGSDVTAMMLEHYPGMAEKTIAGIIGDAQQRWRLIDATVIHRVGRLLPADQIVLVITTSAHRADAFAACEFIMDFLKVHAPFWKKETSPEGDRWVEFRQSDDQAAQQWTRQSRSSKENK